MSTDPQPVASECGKCGKPSVQGRPSPDAESDGNDGSQAATAAAASTPPSPSCSCPKRDSVAAAAAALERDSTEEVLMDIDNDLTTNERMPTMDELELEQPKPKPKLKPMEVVKKEREEPAEQKPLAEEQPTQAPPSPTDIKIEEEEEEEKPKEKQLQLQEQQSQSQEDMPPSSPEAQPNPSPRVGKITRSSLNGSQASVSARTPAIMKRLRKSTRFKAKPTGGRGNSAAGNSSQANGHNNGPNNGASGSSTHLAGAGAHPSNMNKHGKSGTGGPGGGSPAVRNRRTLFKRPAQKTPKVQACTRFVKSVFYKGSYMQIGDIVSIVDGEQNLYYAQIRGLLVDAYCEKSAFLTWLIPTQDSPDPQEGFDPATYLIGPDEELSRKLCYLEFVMHAPSNYYFDRSTPFPLPDVDEYTAQRSGGFIWTRLPVVKREKGERERETRGRDAAHKAAGGAS
ncbi:hypothetical protein KR032_010479 [Drosophila birchii]|nr:hypothetical protein KR032_010479 [Drosophila birchii]